MNRLIRKAGAGVRRQIAACVQGPLGDVQARLEAVTDAQHTDLQAQMLGIRSHLSEEVTAAVPAAFRAEFGELIRMMRQQGDASDQVAETLGRTLARLGAEVEALSRSVEQLEAQLRTDLRHPVPSATGDRPE